MVLAGQSNMTPRRAAIALLVLGALALFIAWILRDSAYALSLLTNVGVGLLLFASLSLVLTQILKRQEERQERTEASMARLSDEVRQVEEEVRHVEGRLDTIGKETRAALDARDARDRAAVDQFAESISVESATDLLKAGRRLDGVSSRGIRVRIPGIWARLAFALPRDNLEAEGEFIQVRLEEFDGTTIKWFEWKTGESIAQVLVEVADELRRRGEFPGEAFDASVILGKLRDDVEFAIRAKSGRALHLDDMAPLIEKINDQWLLTEHGLECVEERYDIPRGRLHEDWFDHLRKKVWTNSKYVEEAIKLAREYFKPKGFYPISGGIPPT
jgi:membrane protein implicated in regulation of membrane protease activity